LLSTKVEPSLKVTHKIITAPHGWATHE
jgi:hypothetical protein